MGRGAPLIDLLTPRQAAELLGVNTNTLARWVRAGMLPAVTTPGGHRRYRRADVRALSQERKRRQHN
jgi:excisionase family DNA binding protein